MAGAEAALRSWGLDAGCGSQDAATRSPTMPRLCAALIATFVVALTTLTAAEESMPASALDFTLTDIAGKSYPLAQHRGKVVMLVNVASRCGNTPQYAGLETMFEKYKDQGLVIIGVPANNFGAQEPGTNAEIQEFCSSKYHVTFPMLGKVSVKGEDIAPLYRFLTTKAAKPGDVTWNFAKFLIGRDGAIADRFDPKMKPEDPALISSVEAALAKKAEAAK
jgi:glutathione peroxidase